MKKDRKLLAILAMEQPSKKEFDTINSLSADTIKTCLKTFLKSIMSFGNQYQNLKNHTLLF